MTGDTVTGDSGIGDALREALRASRIHAPILEQRPLAGGCIHRVMQVRLGDGAPPVVAKAATADRYGMLEEEAAGLAALAGTDTVRVPHAHGLRCSVAISGRATSFRPRIRTERRAWRSSIRPPASATDGRTSRCTSSTTC